MTVEVCAMNGEVCNRTGKVNDCTDCSLVCCCNSEVNVLMGAVCDLTGEVYVLMGEVCDWTG